MRILIFILCVFSINADLIKDYVIISRDIAEIKLYKEDDSSTIKSAVEGQRFEILDEGDEWIEIYLGDNMYGYIKKNDVSLRKLRVEESVASVNSLYDFIKKKSDEDKKIVTLNKYTYDVNLSKEKIDRDFEGQRIVYGLKAFYSDDKNSKWIYMGDRQVVAIEESGDEWIKISIPGKEDFYYIEKKEFSYSIFPKITNDIKKFIVVDNKNQNMLMLEKKEDILEVVETSMVSTGYDNSKNSFRTPKGVFLVANLKDNMVYKSKKKGELNKGKAPYAVRFSGGNYLHGIPLEEELEEYRMKVLKKWREDLLGSYPLSQGCVRNRDETAEKIFNWIEHERTSEDYIYPLEAVAVLVIE